MATKRCDARERAELDRDNNSTSSIELQRQATNAMVAVFGQ